MSSFGPTTLAGVVALSLALACAPRAVQPPASKPESSVGVPVPQVLTAETFAEHAQALLIGEEPGPRRDQRLGAVVGWLLTRSGELFAQGREDAGQEHLLGALSLLPVADFRAELLDPGAAALRAAARRAARRGEAGPALALYSLQLRTAAEGAKREDIQAHLAALEAWLRPDKDSSSLVVKGAAHRLAVQRALYFPTATHFDAALAATQAWVLEGLKADSVGSPSRELEREEAIEAYRAVKTGAVAITALYLRDGDALSALSTLYQQDLMRLMPPRLLEPLERAAQEDDQKAWLLLYQLFRSEEEPDRPELSLLPGLASAASWGSALALYRTGPRALPSSLPLVEELGRRGLGEVVPLVLSQALPKSPTPEDVSVAAAYLFRALESASRGGDPAVARRVFARGKSIVEAAEALQGRTRPSAAVLHTLMGSVEKRTGDLERARGHFQASTRLEPNVEALSALADIDRQRGAPLLALQALAQALAVNRRPIDQALVAELELKRFDLYRDIGDVSEAQRALRAALEASLRGRAGAATEAHRARAELLLSRVLEQYGDTVGARRASERALDASQSSLTLLTRALLDTARRALARADLGTLRDATRRGVEAGLAPEELIYLGVWLHLLEREQRRPSDGLLRDVISATDDLTGWPAHLRAWARGKIAVSELLALALTAPERAEATFYLAFAERGSAPPEETRARLQQVAESPAIDLIEVLVARDLLLTTKARAMQLSLPSDLGEPLP